MTEKELTEIISLNTGIEEGKVRAVLTELVLVIKSNLQKGKAISIADLGTFKMEAYKGKGIVKERPKFIFKGTFYKELEKHIYKGV